MIERNSATRTLVLETGTSQKYQLAAVFTPARYALVRDHSELVIRGVCVGAVGKFVRIENAEGGPDPGAAASARTTSDYLPPPGRAGVGLRSAHPASRAGHDREYPITRFSLHFIEPDLIRMTPLRSGTVSKGTLFADPPAAPKWTKDLTRQKGLGQTSQHRVTDGAIETRDRPVPPAQPGAWWNPVFKIGMRKGEMWTSKMPDGRTVTYTVADFGKDAAGRPTVEIARVEKNPKDATTWQETTITYARGVGEVRRVMVRRSTSGKAYTVLEGAAGRARRPGARAEEGRQVTEPPAAGARAGRFARTPRPGGREVTMSTTGERGERCRTCRFWLADPSECHRHAPSVPVRGAGDSAESHETEGGTATRTAISVWPVTDPDDWCGEWATRADAPKALPVTLPPRTASARGALFLARLAAARRAQLRRSAQLELLLGQLPADVRRVLVRANGLDGRPPGGLKDIAREFKISQGHVRAPCSPPATNS